MANVDPFQTQRDVSMTVVSELHAAGFDDAEEIGQGGFGVVYRCVQVGLDRTVAVKVLTTRLEENRDRFLREQRAMGRMTGHPNIVGVLQVGETESGYPYLVMQYHRRGSLDARIRRDGPLPLDEALRLGVKVAGALDSAHRVGILHRDIKPGNILYTDYGEPALSDFGIAHVTGAFTTATGTLTGSPAFIAPELLSGDPPSEASDVYGLGSTLFCALTGHAAFERRSGEQVVAQFLRITTEPVPDLRERGIAPDVAAVIDKAMARDPGERPSVTGLGLELRSAQGRHGFPVDEMALHAEADRKQKPQPVSASGGLRQTLSNIPAELTSFVGRDAELRSFQNLLATHRLITVTGTGGVGKTRLALRAAVGARAQFPDGVRLVELGESRDGSSLVGIIAAGLGLRDESPMPLQEVLVDFLSTRKLLLVLDNCEQVVDPAAKLVETLLRACPDLRIVATSREALGIAGEAVLQLSPLNDDAVALFAQRAATAVPSFTLTEDNKPAVAEICARLDGLPLAIELAAAKLRVMSLEQLLQRLTNRYAVLTRGIRGAPLRQQTLEWSVGWSYDLCTASEQLLWARLSVFAGSFELEAAEDICGDGDLPHDLVDLLSTLVDKSVLIRTESTGVVRFRLLDTLREFGRKKIEEMDADTELRRRHLDWYRRLLSDAAAEWFSARQIEWIQRVDRELPNVREAMEFALAKFPEVARRMAVDLGLFWVAHGLLGEGRRWLDRTLAATPDEPNTERIEALYFASVLASNQRDVSVAVARAQEAQTLVDQMEDPASQTFVDIADGFAALVSGEPDRACARLSAAVDRCGDPTEHATALVLLARAHDLRGDSDAAVACNRRALELSEAHGESLFRSWALWSVGIESWRNGECGRATDLLKQGLELAHRLKDSQTAASYLEVLAWVAAERGEPEAAAVMMAAAETMARGVGNYVLVFPNLLFFHEDCDRRVRSICDPHAYDAAREKGRSLRFDEAVTYALET